MLDRIQASEAALQKARAELDRRVPARTAQSRSEIAEPEETQVAPEHARDVAEAANRAKSEVLT